MTDTELLAAAVEAICDGSEELTAYHARCVVHAERLIDAGWRPNLPCGQRSARGFVCDQLSGHRGVHRTGALRWNS